jgi:uncharacterized alpha/beta hydrolase family protein
VKKAENFVGVILILVLIFTLIWVNWQRIEKKTPPRRENPLKGIDPQNPFYTPPLEKKIFLLGQFYLKFPKMGLNQTDLKLKKAKR